MQSITILCQNNVTNHRKASLHLCTLHTGIMNNNVQMYTCTHISKQVYYRVGVGLLKKCLKFIIDMHIQCICKVFLNTSTCKTQVIFRTFIITV